jgi:hypothetical protein
MMTEELDYESLPPNAGLAVRSTVDRTLHDLIEKASLSFRSICLLVHSSVPIF